VNPFRPFDCAQLLVINYNNADSSRSFRLFQSGITASRRPKKRLS
jgi:hypothetical protein